MAPFLVSESANEISPTNNNNESHHHQGDHHHQSSGGGGGIGGFQSNYGIEGIGKLFFLLLLSCCLFVIIDH